MKRAPAKELATAERLHQAGRLAEAVAAYRAVLATRPDHAVARHRIGVLALQAGQPRAALDELELAARLAPRDALVRHDLGHALAALGRLADAAAAWAEAGRLAPRLASAHANQGMALAALGRFAEAAPVFRAALQADPNHRDAWLGHADSLLRCGRPADALSALDRARVRVGPHPDFALVRAAALRQTGDPAAALAVLDEAVAAAPRHAGAWAALGLARLDQGDPAGAAAALERAEALDPASPEAPFNRATAERERDRLGAALAALERAIRRRPGFASAHLHRGFVLLDQGRPVEAVAALDQVLAIDPGHAGAASARLFALNYRDDLDGAAIAAAHRRWGEGFAAACPAQPAAIPDRAPGRRLRIGYVSADFRTHSVAWFLEPLLAHHDRDRFEVAAYADVATGDATTARLRAHCGLWRDIHGLDDAAVADRVRADAIDLLVDLGGHTAYNRLGVFARRPAPLQATWLGYPNTTGLAAIDFRITDATADPPGGADADHVERLVRLPRPFLCYAPPPDPPPARAAAARPVTFGSFNALAKMSPSAVAAWAAILAGLPDARLLLKARGLDDPDTAAWWRGRFAAAGADPARIDLHGRIASAGGHLALYGAVDVALDPFPYNGTTTTMEALAMGVPVVALAGDRHAGRVGAAILGPLGLGELVAQDVAAYVRLAVGLGRDGARRQAYHDRLPGLLRGSTLCDGPGFAAAMEAAFLAEWRRLA
ncbi:hypothetical protein STVA_10580 [Allostella vacuolata]|nr:hypothetical protein STVA_10580 [Stella vacuolata]